MNDRLALSTAEAAEALGVSRPTVYALLHREDFPAFKIGGRTLISAEGLREWVRAQAQRGGGGAEEEESI